MDHEGIEDLADQVRKEMEQDFAPVDIERIAAEEGILLGPSDYGEGFDARIEFHPRKGKFLLFYQRPDESHPPTRVRFSIAHELGHYYLPSHRELLVQGKAHNSRTGFVCDNQLEREADFFAAALLLPRAAMNEELERRKFLTLSDVLRLAGAWECSAISGAIRYVQYVSEPVAAVLSSDKEVLFYIPSEDAAYRGFQFLGHKRVPPNTATARAAGRQGSGEISEGKTSSKIWFSFRRATSGIWEEAFPLGYTGLVLTLFAFDLDDGED